MSPSGHHPRQQPNASAARTPSRKRSRPQEEMANTTPSESKIIWRDSPVEKQIKASGTGRVQVEKEMYGFVDRLERASAHSPSLSIHKSAVARACSRASELGQSKSDPFADRINKKQGFVKHHEISRRRALETGNDASGSDAGPPIVRHLLFSPDANAKKKARQGITNREIAATTRSDPVVLKRSASMPSESQDEILVALDKIDEKYSTAILPPSSTEFGTSTPPTTRTTSTTNENNNTINTCSSFVTPKSKKSFGINRTHNQEDEFGSPFTEESWQIIDQLEFEASQKIVATKPSTSIGARCSSTSSPHRTRQTATCTPCTPPLVPSTKHKHKLVPNDIVTPNASRQVVPTNLGDEEDQHDDFEQLLVLDVVRDGLQRQLLLHTVDALDRQIQVALLDDWFELEIDVGATINVIACSVLERQRLVEMLAMRQIIVDTDQLVVIVHPHTLISPTTVTSSIECLRRGVLKEIMPISQPTNPKALMGTLKHKLFEKALFCGVFSKEFLLQHAQEIIQSSVVQLCECGLEEQQAFDELQKAASEYQDWMARVFSAQGVALDDGHAHRPATATATATASSSCGASSSSSSSSSSARRTRVRVHRVVAIEEMIWSGKWGLKGAMDATIEVSFDDQSDVKHILPLELKTGNKVYTRLQHEGQVILYTLLLNERYPCPQRPTGGEALEKRRIPPPPPHQGLLLYVPGTDTHLVQAWRSHLRGLLIARNQVASFMAKYKSSVDNGSLAFSGTHAMRARLPPMLSSRRDCEKCFQRAECFLAQASPKVESTDTSTVKYGGNNGSHASGGSRAGELRSLSGVEDLVSRQTAHLSTKHLDFFQRWCRLIDLEQVFAEQNATSLRQAMQSAARQARRNSAGGAGGTGDAGGGGDLSGSISELELVSTHTSLNIDSGSIKCHYLTLAKKPRGPSHSDESQASLQLRFRAEDQVILSAQSLCGTHKRPRMAVLRGQITSIGERQLVLRVGEAIPELIMQGRSSLGREFCWRIDKDVMLNGFNRSKENLVRLFTGIRPESNMKGVCVDRSNLVAQQQPQVENAEVGGDVRRRQLIVDLVKPRFNGLRLEDFIKENARKNPMEISSLLQEFQQLNLDQQEAVEKIINAMDYTLVLGMPGTGKTSTMAFVVRVLVWCGFSVLITSYTHAAVDNLLLKVLEKSPKDLELLRVGNVSQVDARLRKHTLEEQALTCGGVAQLERFLTRVPLVASTCLSVNSSLVFQKRRFDFCVVDEASQLTLPIILGPLRCADTFTLVGDQYQLPPLVASRQARVAGLDHSLFALLADAFPDAMKRLTVQYRMNQDIVLVANRLVYSHQLKCGSDLVASNCLRLAQWDNLLHQFDGRTSFQWIVQTLAPQRGVAFVDTDTLRSTTGLEQKTGTKPGGKLVNFLEAELMVALVAALVFGGLDPREIGLLSPFRSQVNLINQLLHKFSFANLVQVSTIDKYQGQDRSVVLISFVRANDQQHVGELLTDWRRLNVALTRAKQKLILIGSIRTLSGGSALLNSLCELVREQNWQIDLPPDTYKTIQEVSKRLVVSTATTTTTTTPRPFENEPEPQPDAQDDDEQEDDEETCWVHATGSSATQDIEDLLSASKANNQVRSSSRHPNPHLLKPITRNIFQDEFA